MSFNASAIVAEASAAPATAPTPESPATQELPPGDQPATSGLPVGESAAKRFAAASRREKALQKQRDDIASAKTAIEAEKAEIARQRADFETRYGTRPANPLEALKRFGYSYNDATDYQLSDGQPPTAEQIARSAVERAETLERSIAEDRQTQEQARVNAAQQAVQQTLEQFGEEVNEFIDTAPTGHYELVHLYDAKKAVYDVIEETFHKSGRVLSIKEGADLVEKYLERHADKILSASKIKAKIPAINQPPAKPGQVPAQSGRTLSQSMTPSTTPTVVAPSNVQDAAMQRALRALG